MAIFRRGAIYWWRRNPPQKPSRHPITLRLSLRTASASEAKARAAALEVAWDMVEAIIEQSLRPTFAIEDLSRIYHLAFKTELDRIILRQVATPMMEAGHARPIATMRAILPCSRDARSRPIRIPTRWSS